MQWMLSLQLQEVQIIDLCLHNEVSSEEKDGHPFFQAAEGDRALHV